MRLLLGGSPCTHWSIAQKKDRETEPYGIGWELFLNFLIAKEKYKPEYFLYENNKSMSPAIRAEITKRLGVEPICINSTLVSAQNRQRLYWTNIPGVTQPEDRGIVLQDILESGFCWKEKGYALLATAHSATAEDAVRRRQRNAVAEPINYTEDGKAYGLKAQYYKSSNSNFLNGGGHFPQTGVADPVRVGDFPNQQGEIIGGQSGRIYSVDGKAPCLCGRPNGGGPETGRYAEPIRIGTIENDAKNADFDSQQYRVYSPEGKSVTICGRGGGVGAKTGLYAVPEGMAWRGREDGSNYEVRGDQKSNAVTADGHQSRLVIEDVAIFNNPHGFNKGGIKYNKTPTLTANGDWQHNNFLIEAADGKTYPVYAVVNGQITIKGKQYPIRLADGFYIIRKLTVTECKRLQTVPEDYIFPVSDSQAYKMLGNGWTVDVIAHILSFCPGITKRPLYVLSMYDGMSCGHIALDKLGSRIERYYATEIDKYCIQTAQENFPDIIQLGDAFQVRDEVWELPEPPKVK